MFYLYAETNLAPTTVKLYRAAVNFFTRIIPNTHLGAVSSLDLERLKAVRLRT